MENNKFIAIIVLIAVFYLMGFVTGIEYERSCMKDDKLKYSQLEFEKSELEVQHLRLEYKRKLSQ